MLVTSRAAGEAILIGDGIVVEVLGPRSGKVRLGITAPPGVPVTFRDGPPDRDGNVSNSSLPPTRAQLDEAEAADWQSWYLGKDEENG